jgi:hypothetical protein
MQRGPTLEEVDGWFASPYQTGMGYVCGTVSDGLEALDFDDAAAWTAFEALVEDHGLEDLWRRVSDGYLERTPGGGYHILWRTDACEGSQKLACRPVDRTDKVLIETRGEGGFIVVAPSHGTVHGTGRPYELVRGGVNTIAAITADEREVICAIARMLDERARKADYPKLGNSGANRPGDQYNTETNWNDVLTHYGWDFAYSRDDISYWRRPGKNSDVSASTNWHGNDLLHVFTTSTSLQPDRSYDRFAFYALMEHEGDFSAAARTLAREHTSAQQLRQELAVHGSVAPVEKTKSRLLVRSLDSVQPTKIDWLWQKWLARGKFHLLGGLPGDGKSTLAASIAAIGSTGGVWPDGTVAPPFRTLFFLGEDDVEDTLHPRLQLHGADFKKIHAMETVLDDNGREQFFNVQRHLSLLEDAIEEFEIDLLVIDPLTTVMAGSDRNSEGSVRDALTPLTSLANRKKFAVLGIVHVGKSSGAERSATQRILGATAFGASARVVWMTAPASDGMMALGVTKANLTKRPPAQLWSRPEDQPILWHGKSAKSIDDLVNAGPQQPRASAEEFLWDILATGAQPVNEVEQAAQALGISKRTLHRAKAEIGVESRKANQAGGQWWWELPAP